MKMMVTVAVMMVVSMTPGAVEALSSATIDAAAVIAAAVTVAAVVAQQ